MYRLLVILVVCLFSLHTWGQKLPDKLIQKQLDELRSITDVNTKRTEITHISDRIYQYLTDSSDAWQKLSLSNQISASISKDSIIQVVSFFALTYPDAIQFEWFVKVNRGETSQVYHFSDELQRDPGKSTILARYTIEIADVVRNQMPFYQLKLTKLGKSTQLFYCDDILTKCLFEDLNLATTDAQQDTFNHMILDRLNQLWLDKSTFESDFQQFKRMKTLFSEDGSIKVCTYNVQREGFQHLFYGAVIRPGANNNVSQVYALVDKTDAIRSPERATLSNEKWFGAVYIDLIETSVGNRTYYTLLGYKGHDEFVKTRVLDVMYFQNNRLRFGSSIFKNDRLTRHRMIFKYAAGATMMMRYDRKLKMIVMDNLAPAQSFYRGVYRYYGPDFSYNAYRFKKGYWELEQDIDLRNAKGVNAPLNNN